MPGGRLRRLHVHDTGVTESCGRFIADRSAGGDNPYRGWLTGYLSRYNWAQDGTYNILGHTDVDGALLWIENYCRVHPLDNFASATRKLINELYPNRLRGAPAR